MATTFNGRRKVRKSFGSIREVTEMPNLIEVQKASYDEFLLVDEPKGGRPGPKDEGGEGGMATRENAPDVAESGEEPTA